MPSHIPPPITGITPAMVTEWNSHQQTLVELATELEGKEPAIAAVTKTQWNAGYQHSQAQGDPHGTITSTGFAPAVLAALPQPLSPTASTTFARLALNTVSSAAQLHVTSGDIDRPAMILDMPSGATANAFEAYLNGVRKVYLAPNGMISGAQLSSSGGSVSTRYIGSSSGNTYSYINMGLTSNSITFNTNNTDRYRTDATGIYLMGALGTHAYGHGDPTTDGSWRQRIDPVTGAFLTETRTGGIWIVKQSIAA